jgi:hypothetical protein
MELFAWDERYHTGELIVDREHRGLFALINRVAELDAAQAGALPCARYLTSWCSMRRRISATRKC